MLLQAGTSNKMQQYESQRQNYPRKQYRTVEEQGEGDELRYFRLGQERERLRSYVQQQLNGEETRRNERILVKFQEQAQIRRHNYLYKFSPTSPNNNQRAQHSNNYTYNSNLHNPQMQGPNQSTPYKSRFYNYIPGDKAMNFYSPALIPTQKTKPPAYNYYNLLPHRNFEHSSYPNQILRSKTIEQRQQSKGESFGTPDRYQRKIYPKHSRAVSLDFDESTKDSYRRCALKKIKQVALSKRNKTNNQKQYNIEDTSCSQGQSIISQLQLRHLESLKDCQRLAYNLKKMKKYRKYIASYQSRLKPE